MFVPPTSYSRLDKNSPRSQGALQNFLKQEARSARLGRLAQRQEVGPRHEARAAPCLRHSPEQPRIHGLRFLSTGTIAKAPIIRAGDIQDIITLMQRLQPTQIYVAGERPTRTARIASAPTPFSTRFARCGPWTTFRGLALSRRLGEWEPHEIERVVPLEPGRPGAQETGHLPPQSQKDRAMFPGGADRRSSGNANQDRNRNTASSTINSVCRSFMRSRASCSGAMT